MINRIRRTKIIGYVFALLTILNYLSVYYRSSNKIFAHVIDISWEFILFCFFAYALKNMSENRLQKLIIFSSIFFIVSLVLLILYYLYYPFPIDYFFIYLIDPIMLISIFMSNGSGLNIKLLLKIENIMVILSVVSILFWIIYTLGIHPGQFVSLPSNATTPSYMYLDFFPDSNSLSFLGVTMFRNSGIFIEPSIYAYMLCVALMIEYFVNKNSNKTFNRRSIILLITLFTTTSTTGIIIALPIVVVNIILNTKNISLKVLLCMLIPIALVAIKVIISNKIKLSSNYNTSSSYYIRQNDIYASIKAWEQHPLIGNGLGNETSLATYMYSFRGKGTGSFTGFLTALAYGGIPYSLFFILPTIASMKYSLKILMFSLFSFILFIFTSVLISYTYIVVLSFLWACALINSPLLNHTLS